MPIEIPKPYEDALLLMSVVLAALVLLWFVTTILRYLHRRAYNLTKVESGGGGVDLSFTRVDAQARAAALARGEAYVRPADAETEAKAAEKEKRLKGFGLFARTGALVLAIANVALGALTAVSVAEDAQANLERVDCFAEVVSRFKLGFILAAVVLLAESSRFMKRNRFFGNPEQH